MREMKFQVGDRVFDELTCKPALIIEIVGKQIEYTSEMYKIDNDYLDGLRYETELKEV